MRVITTIFWASRTHFKRRGRLKTDPTPLRTNSSKGRSKEANFCSSLSRNPGELNQNT